VPPGVVDASALVETLLQTHRAATAGDALRDLDLYAPAHLDAELLSALFGLIRAGAVDEQRAHLAIRRLRQLDLERVPIDVLALDALALRHNLSAYDALYVALARRLRCSLVTADRRIAAAPGLGIVVSLVA
jgi:predicted nucleic acid-binding protein